MPELSEQVAAALMDVLQGGWAKYLELEGETQFRTNWLERENSEYRLQVTNAETFESAEFAITLTARQIPAPLGEPGAVGMTPEETAVIEAARRWAGQRLQLDEGTKLYDLREAVEALAAAGVPLPKAWDEDRPGCAPETCGGSDLDPCSAVVRTEGAVHDDDELGGPLPRTWGEIAEGDRVQGSDGSYYRVLRVAEGGGSNLGRTVVTMRIGGEARPYPMSPEGDVLVKRGPAGIAVERLRAAGLGPEALR